MRKLILGIIVLLTICSSCSTTNPLFNSTLTETNDNVVLQEYFTYQDVTLKIGDRITVSIWGHEELSIGSVNSIFSSNEATGRWLTIDALGEVNLPKIGALQLAGYTAKEANIILEKAYSSYIKNPIINLKVLNYYVTVLGEVEQAGKYDLGDEKVTLLEMIAMAGGLDKYADPSLVKVVRTIDNQPIELLIDLTDIRAAHQFNIILQPEDIIYVASGGRKPLDENLQRLTPVASLVTAVAVLISILAK